MPLVVDQLRLWTIGFKWAGLDPTRVWLQIPEPVKDNFSTLLEAILNMHLDCMVLNMDKYHGEDHEEAMTHIRYWTEDIYAAINGRNYSRKLLKFALIERGAFRDWCERCTIPLPEFWFPTGWTDYRWPEDDPTVPLASSSNSGPPVQIEPIPNFHDTKVSESKMRDDARFRIASQVIAEAIWKQQPETTIAGMVQHDLVQNYGGAKHYGEESVRRWIKLVAPPEVSAKRGRPKKQNPTEDE